MLKDIVLDGFEMSPIEAIINGYRTPKRIAEGVYTETGFNFHHSLRNMGYDVNEWTFEDEGRALWQLLTVDNIDDEQRDALFAKAKSLPASYGVCDNWEQIVETWPELEDDPRHFIIALQEIRRDEQPERGGWRWHKWGEYIGTQDSQMEYLHDEPEIETVYVFHIYEIKE